MGGPPAIRPEDFGGSVSLAQGNKSPRIGVQCDVIASGPRQVHAAAAEDNSMKSCLDADHRMLALSVDGDGWTRKAILNVASSGTFSSARTIAEYATDIWNVKPCPVR